MDEREKILKKIHALMAKTVENGASEKEALLATAKVAELLEKYNLSMSDVDIKNTNCEEALYQVGKKQAHPVSHLAGFIAELTNCKAMISTDRLRGLKYINYFGFPNDTEVAIYITEIVHRAMEKEFKIFKKTYEYKYSNLHAKTKRQSFMVGMVMRLQQRIAWMVKEREMRRQELQSTGTDLIVLKKDVINEEYEEQFPDVTKAYRKPRAKSRSALEAGYEAGDNVEFTPGLKDYNGSMD